MDSLALGFPVGIDPKEAWQAIRGWEEGDVGLFILTSFSCSLSPSIVAEVLAELRPYSRNTSVTGSHRDLTTPSLTFAPSDLVAVMASHWLLVPVGFTFSCWFLKLYLHPS